MEDEWNEPGEAAFFGFEAGGGRLEKKNPSTSCAEKGISAQDLAGVLGSLPPYLS
jgi:hypothetical protein